MTCDEVRAALLGGEELEVEPHLAACPSCRSEAANWRRWRATLAEPTLWEEPSPEAGARIMAAALGVSGNRAPVARRGWEWGVAVAALALLVGAYGVAQMLAPDWSLQLTAHEVGATADVDGWNTETGTRMRLRVMGIDPAPPGHYYEIWLTAADGRHVSAGTFRDAGTVDAWAGVRRSEFPRIWITLEQVDDDLGPSRDAYFDTVG